MSQCVPSWVYPALDCLCFLDLVDYFLSHVREVFSYYLFKYFLRSFLSSSSGTPTMQMLVCLLLSQRSLWLSSFLFFLFYIFCSIAMIFTVLSPRSFICSWKWKLNHPVMSNSLRPHGLYSPWNSPGQNTGVGSLSLLQGIFPTQGSNPGLLHCRQILYQLSHKGSPRILEWVACPFSRGSSRHRNWTGISCIEGGFLTNWAVREALSILLSQLFCYGFLLVYYSSLFVL